MYHSQCQNVEIHFDYQVLFEHEQIFLRSHPVDVVRYVTQMFHWMTIHPCGRSGCTPVGGCIIYFQCMLGNQGLCLSKEIICVFQSRDPDLLGKSWFMPIRPTNLETVGWQFRGVFKFSYPSFTYIRCMLFDWIHMCSQLTPHIR